MDTDDKGRRFVECTSSPCMLHELDAGMPPEFAGRPVPDGAQDWADVRLWRKAKTTALIERRLAISAADRAADAIAVTAQLTDMLEHERGRLVGFYWPFRGNTTPGH